MPRNYKNNKLDQNEKNNGKEKSQNSEKDSKKNPECQNITEKSRMEKMAR